MTRARLAPVLSAMSTIVSAWIMSHSPARAAASAGRASPSNHPYESPGLRLADRPAFGDLHLVSDLRLALLVMGMQGPAAGLILAVFRMLQQPVDADLDRLAAAVRLDDAHA